MGFIGPALSAIGLGMSLFGGKGDSGGESRAYMPPPLTPQQQFEIAKAQAQADAMLAATEAQTNYTFSQGETAKNTLTYAGAAFVFVMLLLVLRKMKIL